MQLLVRQKQFLLVLSLIVLSSTVQANFGFIQNPNQENKEIDLLIQKAETIYKAEKYEEALEAYQNIVKKSKEENYSKGLTIAYIGISSAYFNLGKLDLSTSYLLKAKNEDYAQNNPIVLYNISFRKALNLHSIGLYDEAVKHYKKTLQFADEIENEAERKSRKNGVLINMGDIYQSKKQQDSALYYYKLTYKSESDDSVNKFTSAISIAEIHTEQGEMDSAQIYLNFADHYAKKVGNQYSEAMYNEILGKYLKAEGNYTAAIEAFQTSLRLNAQIKKSKPHLLKLLSETYLKNKQEDLANAYLKKYVITKDSLEELNKRNLKVPILLAKTEKEQQLEKASSHTKWILMSSGLLILAMVGGGLYRYNQLKKKGQTRKHENLQLKRKLNNAFDEVVELAKTNSPNFLSRFIEVYPEFYNKLISEYPDLTTADVRLCALMKLDFSTKEIAEISFSSLRTVQNRMYKLRKKFNLQSDEKLNRWIQTFQVDTLL